MHFDFHILCDIFLIHSFNDIFFLTFLEIHHNNFFRLCFCSVCIFSSIFEWNALSYVQCTFSKLMFFLIEIVDVFVAVGEFHFSWLANYANATAYSAASHIYMLQSKYYRLGGKTFGTLTSRIYHRTRKRLRIVLNFLQHFALNGKASPWDTTVLN